MAPDGINTMSDDGKVQTAIGPGRGSMPAPPGMIPSLRDGASQLGAPGVMTKPAVRGFTGAAIGPHSGGGLPPGMEPQQLKQMLPPAMQKPAWQQLQDMGIAGQGSAEANKAMLASKLAGQQLGSPGSPPPSAPMGAPDQAVAGPGGPGGAPPGGPGLPPGAEPGGPPSPSAPGGAQVMPPSLPGQQGMQGGFGGMNPQQLRQMLPPAMQALQGAQGSYTGNPQGLNPQQVMPQPQAPGGGFVPTANAPGGANPYRYM